MQIRHLDKDVCIDSSGKPEDLHQPVGLWPCHRQGGNQVSHDYTARKLFKLNRGTRI